MCLTGVTHFLFAQNMSQNDCSARFGAVIHQQAPITVAVPAESSIVSLADLDGKRMPRSPNESTGWLVKECVAALAARALPQPELVAMDQSKVPGALRDGEVDAIATFADVVPHFRSQFGAELRTFPLFLDVYATGLVVNDAVPSEVVQRVRNAISQVFEDYRVDPEPALATFLRDVPDADPDKVREGWGILQSSADVVAVPGTMAVDGWQATLDWLCSVHGLPVVTPERAYRPELASSPQPS